MKQCWAGGLFVLALIALPASTSAAQGQQSSKDNRTGSELKQNYPNPFSPSTNIRYTLSTAGDVRLDVFNLLGQHVSSLVDGHRTAGEHTVAFDASGLGSGVYFYRIETGCAVQTMKMMLVK